MGFCIRECPSMIGSSLPLNTKRKEIIGLTLVQAGAISNETTFSEISIFRTNLKETMVLVV
jgi:hypothetical protein